MVTVPFGELAVSGRSGRLRQFGFGRGNLAAACQRIGGDEVLAVAVATGTGVAADGSAHRRQSPRLRLLRDSAATLGAGSDYRFSGSTLAPCSMRKFLRLRKINVLVKRRNENEGCETGQGHGEAVR